MSIQVYTCQKPQPKRCKFFLWDDDAQIREKHTLLSNSRSEPDTPKKTPSKSVQLGGLLTPGTGTSYGNSDGSTARGAQTEPRRRLDFSSQQQTPTKIRKSSTLSSDEEAYSWDESLDNEVGNLLGGSSSSTTRPRQPIFTPNKTPRTATNTSPSKRKLDDVFDDNDKPPPYSESVSTTQSSSTTAPFSFSSIEVSATPTPRRYKDVLSAQGEATSHNQPSDLASKILSILDRHDVVVPTTARDEFVTLLDQHHLKTQGIIRGRDISRMALKKKDEEIQTLKSRIERLETEREMDKVVISCLRDNNTK